MASQSDSLRSLENQVGHLENTLSNRQQGTLPNDTENSKNNGKEHCKAIATRSGIRNEEPLREPRKKMRLLQSMPQQQKLPPPFPQCFKKINEEQQYKAFINVLRQLTINILFIKTLKQNLHCIKFMKEVISKKQRLGEFETVALTEGCSAMATSQLPLKFKDPESFTIPYDIGDTFVGKALYDLGDSINLISLSILKKFGSGEARLTTVTL
ncbi:uncharacterized protein LOC120212368 [Hibiscus syriacus]|uniref:uncharacterized protein LOC120212368 n=1 Tax=Hibiscus syriacus TaxID=106335 RepID=UPI001920F649|nr:uncharacterized protein LOC120212368 [Hibiscus syriacus]